MVDIQLIKVNTDNAISHCNELLRELNNLESLKHSLEYIVNTDIPNIWTSDTADVISLSNNLKSNVNFLEDFIRFSKEFSTTLEDYAVALKAIGNEGDGTVEGTTEATDDNQTDPISDETKEETGGEKIVNGPLGSGTSFRDAALEATGKNDTTQTSDVDAVTSASPSSSNDTTEIKDDINITGKKDTSQTDVDAVTSASPSSTTETPQTSEINDTSQIDSTTSSENSDPKFPQSNKEIYDSLMDSYEDSFINHENIFTGDNTSSEEASGPQLVDEGVGPGFTYEVYK